MLKIKIFGTILSAILLSLFVVQVGRANAQAANPKNAPITSPITGPCKPGWGYGDKNHCHSGPPGQTKEHKANNGHNND